MINLSEVKASNKFRALFVAPTGRGKTVAASTFPGKTLIWDFDKRYAPLLDWYRSRPDKLKDIDLQVIHPDNYFTDFQKSVNDLDTRNPYTNLILDGITGLSNTTVVMQMKVKGNNTNPKDKGKTTKGGIAVPSWDEFNGEAMLITQLLETLKSFDSNLIVTAHPVSKTNAASGDKFTSIVSFGTKVNSLIPAYFDEVWFFDYEFGISVNDPVKRLVHTRPSNKYEDAKTSIADIPAILDITNKDLYEVIKPYIIRT